MKFRKKPVVIEAFQLPSELKLRGLPDWFNEATVNGTIKHFAFDGYALITTPEGEMRADAGDWIIHGIKGELSSCKPDIFAATYDDADAPEVDLEAADFSDALMWLKEGKRVQRAGWNGAGQFVFKVKPPQSAAPNEPKYEISLDDTYEVPVECLRPFLMLRTANDELVPWVPSTGDLFAADWLVFTDEAAGGDA